MGKYKYLSDRVIQEGLNRIKENKVKANMPPEVVKACKTLSAYFYGAIPFYDLYEMYCRSALALISERDLEKTFADQWPDMDEKYRNKVWRNVEKVEKEWTDSLSALGEFINRQAKHAEDLADEKIEELESLAEKIAA